MVYNYSGIYYCYKYVIHASSGCALTQYESSDAYASNLSTVTCTPTASLTSTLALIPLATIELYKTRSCR